MEMRAAMRTYPAPIPEFPWPVGVGVGVVDEDEDDDAKTGLWGFLFAGIAGVPVVTFCVLGSGSWVLTPGCGFGRASGWV